MVITPVLACSSELLERNYQIDVTIWLVLSTKYPFLLDILAKLDGINFKKGKRKAESPIFDEYDDDPYDEREEDMRIGKKRVRNLAFFRFRNFASV